MSFLNPLVELLLICHRLQHSGSGSSSQKVTMGEDSGRNRMTDRIRQSSSPSETAFVVLTVAFRGIIPPKPDDDFYVPSSRHRHKGWQWDSRDTEYKDEITTTARFRKGKGSANQPPAAERSLLRSRVLPCPDAAIGMWVSNPKPLTVEACPSGLVGEAVGSDFASTFAVVRVCACERVRLQTSMTYS